MARVNIHQQYLFPLQLRHLSVHSPWDHHSFRFFHESNIPGVIFQTDFSDLSLLDVDLNVFSFVSYQMRQCLVTRSEIVTPEPRATTVLLPLRLFFRPLIIPLLLFHVFIRLFIYISILSPITYTFTFFTIEWLLVVFDPTGSCHSRLVTISSLYLSCRKFSVDACGCQ